MERRQFTRAVAGVSVAGLAGCVASGDESETENRDSDAEGVSDTESETGNNGVNAGNEAPRDPDEVPVLSIFDVNDSIASDIRNNVHGVYNYNSGQIHDYRGYDTVTIQVGALYNGEYVFSPAIAAVDYGTTVQWEWTGEDEFTLVAGRSDPDFSVWEHISEPGIHQEQTFTSEHDRRVYSFLDGDRAGMRGAIIVGPLE